jgi:hypothetical protein
MQIECDLVMHYLKLPFLKSSFGSRLISKESRSSLASAPGRFDRAVRSLAVVLLCLSSSVPVAAAGRYLSVDIADPAPKTPDKTFVYHWDAPGQHFLLFIPGGEGAAQADSVPLHRGLATLADESKTRGRIAVGIFESPYRMPYGSGFPTARTSQDHLRRIESVVTHFRNSTGKQVWIMGHSMGGVSVSEFQKYLEKNNKQDLIGGVIYSNGFSRSEFGRDIQIPVLFLQHEKDRCSGSQARDNRRVYDAVQRRSKSVVEFKPITSGFNVGNEPCDSGHHMYEGSLDDVAREIDQFILR